MRYILSPFYPVANNLDTSHRAAWARYWAHALGGAEVVTTATQDQVLAKLGRNDEVLLYHGMEFKGALNLQSGLTETVVERAEMLIKAKKRGCKFVSLDQDCPMYGSLLGLRGLDPKLVKALDAVCLMGVLTIPNPNAKELIVGDSHALSMYQTGSVVYRADGQTLYGVLNGDGGLLGYVDKFMQRVKIAPKSFMIYFGNIDIRHHLCRQPDPIEATKDLVKRYVAHGIELLKEERLPITFVMPLGIENESRPIPTSGYYKGTPFFGTWAERDAVRRQFVKTLKAEVDKFTKSKGLSVYYHPDHFMNDAGELDFEVMERPRSVHIRPSEYRVAREKGSTW